MSTYRNISVNKKRIYTAAVFIFAVIFLTGCSKQIDPLPNEISGLKLDKKLTGKDANDFLSRMHSGEVGSAKNEIGFYSGDQGGATIYVSYFEDKFQARDEESKMTDKISLGKSAYTNGIQYYIDGQKIFKCTGYSQSHFIFSLEANLYWLTADTEIDRKLLSDYLEYLNN